jgi:hypothetical protein
VARRTIKDLCVAAGFTHQIKNPSEFLHIPVLARIIVQVDKNGQYDDNNAVKRIRPAGGPKEQDPPPTPPKPTPPKPAAKTTGPGAAPWKKAI